MLASVARTLAKSRPVRSTPDSRSRPGLERSPGTFSNSSHLPGRTSSSAHLANSKNNPRAVPVEACSQSGDAEVLARGASADEINTGVHTCEWNSLVFNVGANDVSVHLSESFSNAPRWDFSNVLKAPNSGPVLREDASAVRVDLALDDDRMPARSRPRSIPPTPEHTLTTERPFTPHHPGTQVGSSHRNRTRRDSVCGVVCGPLRIQLDAMPSNSGRYRADSSVVERDCYASTVLGTPWQSSSLRIGENGSSWLPDAGFGRLANVLQTPYRRQTRAFAV